MAGEKAKPGSGPSEAEQLALQEARSRVEKLSLEKEKLRLETVALKRVASPQGWTLELLKAAAVPVAVLSVFVTATIGFVQMSQAADARANERLERAVTRLAGDSPAEKISGVSALRLLLNERNGARRIAAASYLANALALETNGTVQAAILDVLETMPIQGQAGRAAAEEAMRTAIARNRALVSASAAAVDDRERLRTEARVDRTGSLSFLTSEPMPFADFAAALDPLKDFTQAMSSDERKPLEGLAKAITVLTRREVHADSYNGIYCEGCDFSGHNFPDGVSFGQAYLNGANFADAGLKGARFVDADIGSATFFRADLRGASVTRSRKTMPRLLRRNLIARGAVLPVFECADLRGADLSGQVLIRIRRLRGGGLLHQTQMDGAALKLVQVDGATRLGSLAVITDQAILQDHFDGLYPEEQASLQRALLRERPYQGRKGAIGSVSLLEASREGATSEWGSGWRRELLSAYLEQPGIKAMGPRAPAAPARPEGEAGESVLTTRQGETLGACKGAPASSRPTLGWSMLFG